MNGISGETVTVSAPASLSSLSTSAESAGALRARTIDPSTALCIGRSLTGSASAIGTL